MTITKERLDALDKFSKMGSVYPERPEMIELIRLARLGLEMQSLIDSASKYNGPIISGAHGPTPTKDNKLCWCESSFCKDGTPTATLDAMDKVKE